MGQWGQMPPKDHPKIEPKAGVGMVVESGVSSTQLGSDPAEFFPPYASEAQCPKGETRPEEVM